VSKGIDIPECDNAMQANARSEFACKNRKMAGKKFEARQKKRMKKRMKILERKN